MRVEPIRWAGVAGTVPLAVRTICDSFWMACARIYAHPTGAGLQGRKVHGRQEQTLIEKVRALPPEKVAEVEDFVDFLQQRDQDRRLVEAATRLSEQAFAAIWDNSEDAEYDRL
jgi:hypothetical protein